MEVLVLNTQQINPQLEVVGFPCGLNDLFTCHIKIFIGVFMWDSGFSRCSIKGSLLEFLCGIVAFLGVACLVC